MQQIPLSQNKFALVDDSDHPLLSEFRWCYRGERGKEGYAVRHAKVDGKDRLLYLHRHIMQPPAGMEVVFRNHDHLDCRRENLKVVNKEEARRHHRVRCDSKSGVKGVKFNGENGAWSAYTYRNGHCYPVGTYYSQEAAVAAYEAELRTENSDLHAAPARVERPAETAAVQRGDPDAA